MTLEGDRDIGDATYRIVYEGYRRWQIRILRDPGRSISRWVETPTGRARYFRTKVAAERYLDNLEDPIQVGSSPMLDGVTGMNKLRG